MWLSSIAAVLTAGLSLVGGSVSSDHSSRSCGYIYFGPYQPKEPRSLSDLPPAVSAALASYLQGRLGASLYSRLHLTGGQIVDAADLRRTNPASADYPWTIPAYVLFFRLDGVSERDFHACVDLDGSGRPIKGVSLPSVADHPEKTRIIDRDMAKGVAEAHGVNDRVDFPGFLDASAVAQQLRGGLALVLVSSEEQWGLVVNEALAFGLPAIISPATGSGDLLVRNLLNGYVIEQGSPHGLAQAMANLAGDEALWRSMVAASHARAWLGDTERLADAAEALIDASPAAIDKVTEMQQFLAFPPHQR